MGKKKKARVPDREAVEEEEINQSSTNERSLYEVREIISDLNFRGCSLKIRISVVGEPVPFIIIIIIIIIWKVLDGRLDSMSFSWFLKFRKWFMYGWILLMDERCMG